jgi:hypothetical protein
MQLCNISYLPVYKQFKALLRFVKGKYYRDIETL